MTQGRPPGSVFIAYLRCVLWGVALALVFDFLYFPGDCIPSDYFLIQPLSVTAAVVIVSRHHISRRRLVGVASLTYILAFVFHLLWPALVDELFRMVPSYAFAAGSFVTAALVPLALVELRLLPPDSFSIRGQAPSKQMRGFTRGMDTQITREEDRF